MDLVFRIDGLTVTFGCCLVVAVSFLAWLYTKNGKRWLKSLDD